MTLKMLSVLFTITLLASAKAALDPADACQLYVQWGAGGGFDASCDGDCPPVGGQPEQCVTKTTMVTAGSVVSCLCNGVESTGWCVGRGWNLEDYEPFITCWNTEFCNNCVENGEAGWQIIPACTCPL